MMAENEPKSSPSEQLLANVDFRINSLKKFITTGIAAEGRMSPLERRMEIHRRRREVLVEDIGPRDRRETSTEECQKASGEKEHSGKQTSSVPSTPSMSEAGKQTQPVAVESTGGVTTTERQEIMNGITSA